MKVELELTNDQFECLYRAIVDRIVSCTGQANECDRDQEIDWRHWREQALLAKEIRAMLERSIKGSPTTTRTTQTTSATCSSTFLWI
jgi:hypothetical protein